MVKQEIKTSVKILKEKGLLKLLKESFIYSAHYLMVPYYKRKIKKITSKEEDYLVNFVFDTKLGFLRPAQSKWEIKSLLRLILKEKPKNVLEIGTAKGGSLFLITKMLPKDAKIMSLDIRGGSFGGGYPNWRRPLYKSFISDKQSMKLIRGDSHKAESLELVKKLLNGTKLDFLFIDADHTYEGVKRDFEMYSPLVKKGGIIALHDIAKHRSCKSCRVDEFWKEIKKKYKTEEFLDPKDIGWAGIGVIRV